MNLYASNPQRRARDLFSKTFGGAPDGVMSAPGRVNLIGDHTDYVGGFVFPAALRLETVVAYRRRGDHLVSGVSEGLDEQIDFALGQEGVRGWGAYVAGTAWALMEAGHTLGGLDIAVASDVPKGSGLSSSAAIEVALARVWREVCGLPLDDVTIARLCQRAENAYVGVPSGIMDQFASSVPQPGQAILLDCATLHYQIMTPPDTWAFVVVDSGASRSLAGSAYEQRVQECQEVAQQLGLTSLRELKEEHLSALQGTLYRRARHILFENSRVREAADMMRVGDMDTFGKLMNASHRSLKQDYEVSSPALDSLVEAAYRFDGLAGARLTGAGFGGCTVNLLKRGREGAFTKHLANTYPQARVVAVV